LSCLSPGRYRLFYGWNLTNPEGFLRGEKAVLEETGPYAYRSYKTKFNITFTKKPHTQKFRTWDRLVYDPAESCPTCNEQDRLTNLNPVYTGAVTRGGGKESTLLLVAGVPFYTSKRLASKKETCAAPNPNYANTTFPTYTAASPLCSSLELPGDQKEKLNQALCCVLTDATKAQGMLASINDALIKGEPGAIDVAKGILTGCGFNTTQLPSGSFTAVAACMLSYWGVDNPLIPPETGNLAAQVLQDPSPESFEQSILQTDGMVATKTVREWYVLSPPTAL